MIPRSAPAKVSAASSRKRRGGILLKGHADKAITSDQTMTTIRTELPIATEPWERARSLFLEQLSPHERTLFEKADLDTIYHDASVSHRKHQHSSKLQAARRRLAPLVDAIDGYGKGLDVMSNIPVAAALLCPIWGGIRVALYVAQETEKYFEKLAEMLEKIGRTLPLFRDYQNLFQNHGRLLQVLSEAYLNVLRFCTDVTALFKEAKTRAVSVVSLTVSCRTLWKPFTMRFAGYLKDFKDLKQNVQDEANVAHMIESKRERELQERSRALAETRLREEKLRKTLRRFSPIDYHRTHRRLRSECHQGTAQWILDHDSYRSWTTSVESSSIHCNGIPGSGKTILASSIINSLTANPVDPSHLVCFYYCDYADQQTLDPAVILGTFIRQILEGSHHAEELREWVINEWADRNSNPLWNELSKAVLDAFARFKRVTVILDALDELSPQSQHDIGSVISEFLSSHACQVKVFLSCRFEAIILSKIPQPEFSIALSSRLLSGDIYRFVEDMVQEKIDRKDLTIQDPALQQEINRRLQEGAQDMFLWIKFQIEELCEAMSDIELRRTLQNLPKDLAGTYRRILYKITSSTRGNEKIKLARRAFRWIVCAKQPLTIEELIEAVVLEEDDESFPAERVPTDNGARLRLACGNLVVFDEEYGLVRLAHHTVQQFLTGQSITDPFADDNLVKSFRFEFDEAELQIYRLCLAYLCFSDFENQVTRVESSTPRISETGGFVRSLISYMLPDSGTVGRLTYLLNGRPHSRGNLNEWNLSIQSNTYCVNREKELKQKYSLLGYVSFWWCFHSPREWTNVQKMTNHETIQLDERSRAVVFEKNFPFLRRPWDNESSGDGYQQTPFPMFRWVARTGKFAFWVILTGPATVDGCMGPFHDAMQYDNEERDLLADILHGGNEKFLNLYFSIVRRNAIGTVIPSWIICRVLRLSPKSTHAALFARLKGHNFEIARGQPETRSFWPRASTSTFWFDQKWPETHTSGFKAGAGTFLLEEAIKQGDIDLVRCILESDVGGVVYFGPAHMGADWSSEDSSEFEYASADEWPLARAAYANNIAMVEVLFSYINGAAPFVGAQIETFDLGEFSQVLRQRDLVPMAELVETLSRSGLRFRNFQRPRSMDVEFREFI